MSVVEVLLKDPRVDATQDDNYGCTPLCYAARYGRHTVIERLIASGRDLGDIKNKKGKWVEGEDYTALEIAKQYKQGTIVILLERFLANPAQIRQELRVKLGVVDELAAELFALIVFLCDDLLQLKPVLASTSTAAAADATRFFTIAKKLAMELQMVLSRRVTGSMKQNILLKDSEAAFKSLAWILLLPSPPK